MTKDPAALTPEHAALHARFRTMLSGPFINLHIRRDIEMAEKVLESIPAMLEQARAEGREEALKAIYALRRGTDEPEWNRAIWQATETVRSLSATRKGSDDGQ